MKLLQGILQPSGYRIVHLVDPEDLDLLRFEETWETPEGLDFALWWNGAWHEGRCYDGFPERTFVIYGTAQRLPLRHGMRARLPHYTLGPDRLLELTSAYVQELGYLPTKRDESTGKDFSIAAGESIEVPVPVANEPSPVMVTISLSSNGDIRLLATNEPFLTTPPFDSEDTCE